MTKLKYAGSCELASAGGAPIAEDGMVEIYDDNSAAYLVAHRPNEFTLVSSSNPGFSGLVKGHQEAAKPKAPEAGPGAVLQTEPTKDSKESTEAPKK
jgi:hypothetical protein